VDSKRIEKTKEEKQREAPAAEETE